MNRVFLLTGSNLGDSISLLNLAAGSIGQLLGKVVQKSHIYRSESWGYKSDKVFYNQCLVLETEYEPYEILDKILEIEKEMGRIRIGEAYSDREIDIDVLLFGEEIIEVEGLCIPHPRLHLRKFVLVPLNEVAPDIVHPVFKKTISELLNICTDHSIVRIDHRP
jgi:2-amino-4-hydroxy-6-hydroxymethyldihydropteridine diphosphokinase